MPQRWHRKLSPCVTRTFYNPNVLPGIILAAGRSSRFGRPKALLPAHGTTFVGGILAAYAAGGITSTVVVIRPGDQGLREEVARVAPAARTIENPHAEAGQLTSLVAGLNAVDGPGVEGAIVTLVDVPLVTSSTIGALLDARSRYPDAPILRATYRGRHGHPVIFARAVFEALRRADPAVGAKDVFRQCAGRVHDVDVNDAGVIDDVDTPADYVRLFGREP